MRLDSVKTLLLLMSLFLPAVAGGFAQETRSGSPERPASHHLYLHILPLPGDSDADETRRRAGIEERLAAALARGGPRWFLEDRLEQGLNGHLVVRWTVKIWTRTEVLARVAAAGEVFGPEEKVAVMAVPVERKTVESRGPAEIGEKLRTDTGAVHEWYRERFGPSFPMDLLTSADGGAVFDFSKVREGTPGLDSAGVLFDATGRPRDPVDVEKRIQLALAKPRARSGTDPAVKPPPAPLKHDGFVASASAGPETHDQLRSLIYASRGYEKGFAKGSGLYGPMGLSKATFKWARKEADAEQARVLSKGVHDDEANILAGAIILERLKTQFGGDLSRAVAAFHVGAGNVRKHGGIPPDARHFLARFQLAHQQGVRRALDPSSPRVAKKIVPERPVSPVAAILRRLREESIALTFGEPPTGRRDSFLNVPKALVEDIRKEATTGRWQTDPNALIALSEAEGGVNAGTSHANARGVLQITPETALWECGLSRAELADRSKNIACAEKVFARRLEKVDGDIVLAWAMYNTKVKWHKVMMEEKRVVGIKETVRHVTRAAYRYFQLTGDARFDPGSRAFREKYFKSSTALRWSAQAYQDVQRWDRNEGFRGAGEIRRAEKIPALEGASTAHAGPTRAPGRWKRNSTGTHWYRSSRKPGQRWDIHPYRDRSGRVTAPPV